MRRCLAIFSLLFILLPHLFLTSLIRKPDSPGKAPPLWGLTAVGCDTKGNSVPGLA